LKKETPQSDTQLTPDKGQKSLVLPQFPCAEGKSGACRV
jgi:hypothetical protein